MERIKKLIIKNNSISLNRFINFCLYEKKRGYYHNKKIGDDFITSPETSQMFGECISFFFLTLMEKINVNDFCELGPGNGTLANDIIRCISKLKEKKINFFLHEKSNSFDCSKIFNFKNIKIHKLKKFRIEKKPYFFICNEFFDALPINQIKKINGKFYEKRISIKNNEFFPFYKKFIAKKSYNSENLKNNQIIETSPLMDLYLKRIFRHIKNFGGGILIFDYGPFEKRRIDTLQAIHKKKKCGIFEFPFKSDITYHIDFRYISNQSKKFGLYQYGPIHQKKFLYFYGINERLNLLLNSTSSEQTRKNLNEQFIKLTDPNGMGNLIKCMFICSNDLKIDAFNE